MNVQLSFGSFSKAGLCAIIFLFSSVFGFSQQQKWYTHKDTVNNFIVDFPSAPVKKPAKGFSVEFEYNDKANGILYTSTALYTGRVVGGTADQLLSEMLNKYLEGDQIKLQYKKKLGSDTLAKMEAGLKKDNKFIRVIYYLKNDVFYALSAESLTNNLDEGSPEYFFNSFKITATALPKTSSWVMYKNSEGAFRINLPGTPQEAINEVLNKENPGYPSYVMNMFMSTDKSNMANYIVRYNDYPAGTYIKDKDLTFKMLIDDLKGKGKVEEEVRVIFKGGYEGRTIVISSMDTSLEIQIFIRGNRVYLLMRQNMKGNETIKSDFFDSFDFEKYAPNEGVVFSRENVSLRMPSEPISVPNEDEDYKGMVQNTKSYYVVNKNSGGLYGLDQGTLGKYARIKNMDTLYQRVFKSLTAADSSNYILSDVFSGNVKGKEYYSKDTANAIDRKIRVFINNDQYYVQSAFVSSEEMNSPQSAEFFNSLKFGPHNAFDQKSSKASLLFEDSKSTDSITHLKVLAAFNYYEFDKEELPLIYDALKLKYADDTTSNGVRALLIRQLTELNDGRTVTFLKELFQDAGNTDVIKAEVLPAIVGVDKNNYDWYFNSLLTATPLKLKEYWDLFTPLNDSLSYAATNFDKLLTLLKVDQYRLHVLDLVVDMLSDEDKSSYLAAIESRKEKITERAMDDVVVKKSKLDYSSFLILYRYLYILPEVKMPQLTDEFTKKIFSLDSAEYLHTIAFAARIKSGLPLDPAMLSAQLDSLSTRYDIMSAFNAIGKLESVPVKYRKHEEFAKLILYNYLVDDYDAPNSIRLLGKVMDDKDIYYAFEFNYLEEQVIKTYIGICGPFDNKSGKLNFEGYTGYTNFEEKTEDWLKQAKALIEEMK
ncbi:hypothetical protein [Pedobacter metabolipauper]|uniref:Uncharacterized protein n=1 Tax=Pedobacter metabolipauper TaxID=425513 RepID=A0A4R6SY34_9SPHI|nr:hypothetical protein [Pedobacter metabolipauper]TDQ10922.1 hypothetical protein ATK78_0030 [Pedobacter metabolipauper]